jgi:hypothetical protein
MEKKIKLWKPLLSIGGEYWFENLSLKDGNFHFLYKKVNQENINIRIVCSGGIATFKYTNETFTGSFIYGDDNVEEVKKLEPWSFFIIEDSQYLRQTSLDSGGLSDSFNFKHYCIITMDETLDLIYGLEPIVEILVDGIVIESTDPGHHSLDDCNNIL